MDDISALTLLNERFIAACRVGSWEDLEPILAAAFAYVDGTTGERWDMDRYIAELRAKPNPGLTIDDLVIHVAGNTAGVSARCGNGTSRTSRYLDVYTRDADGWKCVQACVWPNPS